MDPSKMTENELREFVKQVATVYVENVNIIASTPIRMPETMFNELIDYSRN